MKNALLTACTALLLALAMPLYAGDEELCLDCHEPAEDWEGMSVEEILAAAQDTGIKRHADNADFTAEQLKAFVEILMAE